ncbi:MAG: folylpolyglutamate synthase/dihydrofolate synthase family protein [Thermodesulfobacteriota bacterium]|nr:folylpolyglutamate synthase/dihydrofolate synthase family protein [Thermodesulfobacteriota bacterium]
MFLSYNTSIQYLYSLQASGIKLGLSNITRLLDLLDNPQRKLKIIHIGGTNGKGSTAAIISSIMDSAGFKVGLYTSPHLIRFTERIKVNNREIPERRVAELTDFIYKRIENTDIVHNITFFEFTTAIALLYLLEQEVDIAILEVGLGGRFDSTNVVSPLLSIITNVSLDHQQYLGNTIRKIAFEKAGIIKEDIPVITAVTQPSALTCIKEKCMDLKAALYRVGTDMRARRLRNGGFNYYGIKDTFCALRLPLKGKHQITNAVIALGAIEVLKENGYKISDESVYHGLENAYWPGRMEVIGKDPLVILDCAHNPAGAKALKDAIQDGIFSFQKLILVMGIMLDKDFKSILLRLVPLAHRVILTEPKMDRTASSQILYKVIKKYRKETYLIQDVKEAVTFAISLAQREDMVLITGSIFTVGEARELFVLDS